MLAVAYCPLTFSPLLFSIGTSCVGSASAPPGIHSTAKDGQTVYVCTYGRRCAETSIEKIPTSHLSVVGVSAGH